MQDSLAQYIYLLVHVIHVIPTNIVTLTTTGSGKKEPVFLTLRFRGVAGLCNTPKTLDRKKQIVYNVCVQ